MTNGLNEVIEKLEQQREAIERALLALREVGGAAASVPVPAPATRPGRAKRKGGMTPEGRKRLSEALRKRWAAKRAASAVRTKTTTKTATKTKRKAGGMTPEGRKRLSEALKKRWAAKRATAKTSQTKRAGA